MTALFNRGWNAPKHVLMASYLCAGIVIAGCSKSEEYSRVALSDPQLAEFKDLLAVDRPKLGLPALPAISDVSVDRYNRAPYDVLLNVNARNQRRTIAFRRTNGVMKWIHEQVIVEGPQTYTTVDGNSSEHIVLTYEISRVAINQLNKLDVSYSGPDANLQSKSDLELSDVQELLDRWLKRP